MTLRLMGPQVYRIAALRQLDTQVEDRGSPVNNGVGSDRACGVWESVAGLGGFENASFTLSVVARSVKDEAKDLDRREHRMRVGLGLTLWEGQGGRLVEKRGRVIGNSGCLDAWELLLIGRDVEAVDRYG